MRCTCAEGELRILSNVTLTNTLVEGESCDLSSVFNQGLLVSLPRLHEVFGVLGFRT